MENLIKSVLRESDFGWADEIQPSIRDFFNYYLKIAPTIYYVTIRDSNNVDDRSSLMKLFNDSGYNITKGVEVSPEDEYLWVSKNGGIVSGDIEDEYGSFNLPVTSRVNSSDGAYGSEYLIDYEDYTDFMNSGIIESKEYDEFDWAKGPITFSVDDIVGKQMYYRENNVEEIEFGYGRSNSISVNDIKRNEVVLGEIIWDKSYILESYNGDDGVIILNNPKDNSTNLNKRRLVNFSVDDIVTYVNLGVWSLEDGEGNIINDFSVKYINEIK